MTTALKEEVFYQDENVLISHTRMTLGGTTYATANITSVSTYRLKPSRKLEIIMGLIGLAVIFNDFFVGLILIGLAGLIFYMKKTKYIVKLSSNASEKDALRSTNKDYIYKIVEAINNAIIYRG